MFYRPAGSTRVNELKKHGTEKQTNRGGRKRRKVSDFDPDEPDIGDRYTEIGEIRLSVWIDDFIFVCDDPAFQWLSERMMQFWDPTGQKARPSKADFVLGMGVNQTDDSVEVTSTGLIDKLMGKFGMEECKLFDTPLPPGTHVSKDDEGATLTKTEHKLYRAGVATVTYLGCTTRPDVSAAAAMLGKVQHAPKSMHMTLLKRTIGYLRGTRTKGIRYTMPKDPRKRNKLTAFADASWADDKDDRRSTHGYVMYMNGGPVSWHSRKAKSVALSTAEAEIAAATEAARDVVAAREMLRQMHAEQKGPTTLHEDNQACIYMSEDINSSVTSRSKHIATRFFWLREQIQADRLTMQYCPTDQMIADMFTKSLPLATFKRLRDCVVTDCELNTTIPDKPYFNSDESDILIKFER